MKLSALLLSLVIALGLSAPLDAKTHHNKQPKVHRNGSYKANARKKPAKLKPMKFRGTKHAPKAPKTPRARRAKTPRSV